MTLIVLGLILLAVYLTAMVVFAQYKGDTSIANFTWGGGVMLVTLFTFFTMSMFLPRQLIATLMIVLWASRLILHVYKRYSGTDPRFTGWKWQGYKALLMNSIWIYGQSIMIAIMSYPLVLINRSSVPGLTLIDLLGIIVWVSGYLIEAFSDQQLLAFMQNPANKGHVIRSGLWRYSRHPNYFGESLMWWGMYIIASAVPFGWTAIIAPVTITFLLRYVTGVPLIERAMANNPEYQEYKKTTSPFIPWFVKQANGHSS